MEKINICFDEHKNAEDAILSLREELERAGLIDEFGNWIDTDFVIALDNWGIHAVYPHERDVYRAKGYSTFAPSFYPDFGDMLYDIELDIVNRNNKEKEDKMEKILNLTQHIATKEQVEAGVFEPTEKKEVQLFLTFDKIPSKVHIEASAIALASLAKEECEKNNCTKVMIGGAPYLMSSLEKWLKKYGLQPVYAFSKRISIDEPQPDGSVVKKMVFKHEGFIEV